MFDRVLFLFCFIFLSACNFNSENDSNSIARYGQSFLSKEVFLNKMVNVNSSDSLLVANMIINNWAIEKILTEGAELNLDELELQKIYTLSNDYRSNMLSETYLEALVNSSINLDIDSSEIKFLYNKNKNLFKLNDDIFKFMFIELPLNFSDTYQVRSKIKRLKTNDKKFLDSISFRFKSFSLESDNWIKGKQLYQKFPFLTEYSYNRLKKYNFFQFKDSLSLYLIKVIESIDIGDISPIDHVLPTLEYMSLNKRKKELMNSIKADMLKDALENNKLEIY